MAKTTWDANRTGGGTYEFSQDAQGKYTLNSIGFQKFGKLNLPDLGKTTQTTKDTTKDTAAASKQTAEAFGDVKPFYYGEEGGKVDQYTMKKEGDLSTDTKPIVPSDRQPGFEIADKRVTPQKAKASETALKHVKTASNVLSKAVGFVMDHTILGKIISGIESPEQKLLNERNSSALSSLGYKTRGELGSNIDPGRIAGNPAHNVFAGMNEQSLRGNIFDGARKRVANRNSAKTQARISKLSPERQKAFNDKTQ